MVKIISTKENTPWQKLKEYSLASTVSQSFSEKVGVLLISKYVACTHKALSSIPSIKKYNNNSNNLQNLQQNTT